MVKKPELRGWPSRRTAPVKARFRRERHDSSEVLPDPEGPRIPTSWPHSAAPAAWRRGGAGQWLDEPRGQRWGTRPAAHLAQLSVVCVVGVVMWLTDVA
jgi:hypothetical protein